MPNVILIVNDTLRADHVACYGRPAPWDRPGHEDQPFIETPALDSLAATGTIFDRCYIPSYPTVPLRHDIVTGRIGFPTQGWQPLDAREEVLSERLERAGVATQFIFDTTPLGDDNFNFMRGFRGWEWIRGQHQDRYVNEPVCVELPAARYKIKSPKALLPYLTNSTRRLQDRDWMAPHTAAVAVDWLERNASRHDGFFLWVDMWDPHEPFDAPQYDLDRYLDPTFTGDRVIYPRYGRAEYLSEGELNDVRARYAANVQMADRAVGRILNALDYLRLADDTMVIFTTDHGHLFGDHGLQGKPTGPLGKLYEATTRVPLIIRHPGKLGAGERVPGIVQHPDLYPTVLEFFGITELSHDGRSLLPLMRDNRNAIRNAAFSGRYSAAAVSVSKDQSDGAQDAARFDGWVGLEAASEPVTVTTEDWSLIVPAVGGPLPELYHLATDPAQMTDVSGANPSVVEDLIRRLLAFLKDHGADPARIAAYDWIAAARGAVQYERVLADDLPLYRFERDGLGLAFLGEEEARTTAENSVVEPTTLGEVLSSDCRLLISIGDQYYRPADLAMINRIRPTE